MRFQETNGIESPEAEQLKDKDSPESLVTLLGGFETNFGADQTTTVVTAEALPSAFIALHTYGPVSCFFAIVSVTNSFPRA